VSTTLVKLGGELLENEAKLAAMGRALALAAKAGPLVIVHGGGRDIDTALAQAGIPKRQVDGLRVTDAPTLEVVVSVLAGLLNTRLVAAINAAGGHAVGLTGVDAGVAPVRKAGMHRSTGGELVDLGFVGEPSKAPAPDLIKALTRRGFVPVIACIGASKNGQLFNVNADTLASSLAGRLGVARLLVAGGTAGVLDDEKRTLPALDARDIKALVRAGTASAGMVAKLRACAAAARAGVGQVAIVDGRDQRALARAIAHRGPLTGLAGTRISA
jgi:acetylglutamate kinase